MASQPFRTSILDADTTVRIQPLFRSGASLEPATYHSILQRISGLILFIPAGTQNKDKAAFVVPRPGFYQNSILKDDREVSERLSPSAEHKIFTADLTGYRFPSKVDLYTNRQWHNPPVSQGNTNTCWCFSTTSFLE